MPPKFDSSQVVQDACHLNLAARLALCVQTGGSFAVKTSASLAMLCGLKNLPNHAPS